MRGDADGASTGPVVDAISPPLSASYGARLTAPITLQ